MVGVTWADDVIDALSDDLLQKVLNAHMTTQGIPADLHAELSAHLLAQNSNKSYWDERLGWFHLVMQCASEEFTKTVANVCKGWSWQGSSAMSSMGARMTKMVDIRPQDLLVASNFQSVYQGTGTPEDARNDEIVTCVAKFALMLAISSRAASAIRKETVLGLEGYGLTDPDGAAKLYTSEMYVGAKPFHELLTNCLGQDNAVQLSILNPFLKRLNFYLNAKRHASCVVWAGVKQVSFGGGWFYLDGERRQRPIELGDHVKIKGRPELGSFVVDDIIDRVTAELAPLDGTQACAQEIRMDSLEFAQAREECDLGIFSPGQKIRILRYLSTSANRHSAEGFTDAVNYLFKIHIPEDFWGARSLAEISVFPEENETLFVCQSLFRVHVVDLEARPRLIELQAIDKYDEIEYHYPTL